MLTRITSVIGMVSVMSSKEEITNPEIAPSAPKLSLCYLFFLFSPQPKVTIFRGNGYLPSPALNFPTPVIDHLKMLCYLFQQN